MTLSRILIILAVVAFVLAIFGVPLNTEQMLAMGLVLFALSAAT